MHSRAICALLVLLCGCAGQQGIVVDGKTYGVTTGVFRGRWWSYYERGESYLSGGLLKEAAADFEHALRGRSRDAWQARTYGLHFVEYFPNRELGVAYYFMGRLDEARDYLERSLKQTDTARANKYLDLVTRAQIDRGQITDAEAPAMRMSLEDGFVSSREVAFELTATDDVGVARVEVNGKLVPQRRSGERVTVADSLLLDEGSQEIRVQIADLADKTAACTMKLEVDLTGPTIGIFQPRDFSVTEAASVRLEGACVDKNRVESVVVLGGAPLAEARKAARVEFAADLPLKDGQNEFIIVARDVAGNETRSAINVYRGKDGAAARLWRLKSRAPELLRFAGPENLPPAPENAPISVSLRSPKPGKPYRHNKTLYVYGDATARTKVAALTINGQPFTDLTGAPKETFSRRIPIDATDVTVVPVEVKARDEEGHETVESVRVEVRPVQLDSPDSKLPLAVLAFSGDAVDPALAELLRTGTEASLFEAGRFRVLDRTRLQDVLTEQQLAAALADPGEAIALGKLTNAQVFLVADVFPRGEGIEIKARAISTETTEILAVVDSYVGDRNDPDQLKTGFDALAAELEKAFPRLSGEILSVRPKPDGDEMLLNWTREDGVREGMYLLVVEQTEPWLDPATGAVIEPGEMVEVARGKIQALLAAGAKAKAQNEQENAELNAGMAAITM